MSGKLSDDDLHKIAESVADKLASRSFYINDEEHYNQHHELGRLLDMIDGAASALVRWVLKLVIIGMIVLAGFGYKHGG